MHEYKKRNGCMEEAYNMNIGDTVTSRAKCALCAVQVRKCRKQIPLNSFQ